MRSETVILEHLSHVDTHSVIPQLTLDQVICILKINIVISFEFGLKLDNINRLKIIKRDMGSWLSDAHMDVVCT